MTCQDDFTLPVELLEQVADQGLDLRGTLAEGAWGSGGFGSHP